MIILHYIMNEISSQISMKQFEIIRDCDPRVMLLYLLDV